MKAKVKYHKTAQVAYEETTKPNVIAVKITTYTGEEVESIQYATYTGETDYPEDLREDYPLALGSNQSIEEIDQDT